MSRYEYEMSTLDMPDYDGMGYEELASEAQMQWLRAEHAEKKLECADKQLDELTAENRALKAELKLARGELKNVLHNTEQAKLKAERTIEEYRKLMAQPVEDRWKREIELVRSSRDHWKGECEEAVARLVDARSVLDRTKKYTLVKEG